MATKLEGGGGLVACPLKKYFFCGFPKFETPDVYSVNSLINRERVLRKITHHLSSLLRVFSKITLIQTKVNYSTVFAFLSRNEVKSRKKSSTKKGYSGHSKT